MAERKKLSKGFRLQHTSQRQSRQNHHPQKNVVFALSQSQKQVDYSVLQRVFVYEYAPCLQYSTVQYFLYPQAEKQINTKSNKRKGKRKASVTKLSATTQKPKTMRSKTLTTHKKDRQKPRSTPRCDSPPQTPQIKSFRLQVDHSFGSPPPATVQLTPSLSPPTPQRTNPACSICL